MNKSSGCIIKTPCGEMLASNTIITDKKSFYISYNNRDISVYGSDTTALVKGNSEKCLILNGDHTNDYNQIIDAGGDYNDCEQYYYEHLAERSNFSEDILTL